MKDILLHDSASEAVRKRAENQKIETVWERAASQEPHCGFGTLGICCKNCQLGPCRIDPFG